MRSGGQTRTPPDVERELRRCLDYRYREIIQESGIDPLVAAERDYYLEKTKKGLERLGFTRKQQKAPAMVIPRFSPSGEEIPPQIKPDSPRLVEGRGKVREVKYDYPPNTPVRLSVHPRTVKVLRDIRYPLWIVEGDKKGDALVSHAAAAVVLQGVDCWNAPQDWEEIKLYGRDVIIALDADVMINPKVQRALKALSAFLRSRGAKVKYLRWPETYRGSKTGVDDYLAAGDGTVQDLHRLVEEAPDEEAIPVGVSMVDIKPERVEWLWSRRIPKGKVTILDGDPGKGKSTILYDLAARVSAGLPLPDGEPVEPGGALIVSAEDGAADTIAPRFLAAGGDPKRARILGSDEPFIIPDDLDRLERAIRQLGATLVVIDPVMSFLSDDVNSNRDQDVRRALQPLVDMARHTGAAIVLCRHLNKSTGGQAIYRGQGSIGFIGIVRSGLMVGEHPELENTFVLAGQKHNLSKPPASLAYRIRSVGLGDETAIIEYRGVSEVTAQQMSSTPEDEGERSRLAEAKEFLRDLLRAGPEFTGRIKAEAKEAEIGWRTVERAKAELKVQAVKEPDSGKWQWTLSGPTEEGDEDRPSSARQSEAGGDGGDGGLRDSSERPPSMADMADFESTTTSTTDNKAYIREDRQDRQDRQGGNDDRRGDENFTPPSDSANVGGRTFHRDPTAYEETF
jgi:AAA domain/Domain of unknown function (DUF3854)